MYLYKGIVAIHQCLVLELHVCGHSLRELKRSGYCTVQLMSR